MTPRDHFFTALVTVGEGYHNFHHQFPMDYRNAVQWYQFDPTKWFIGTMSKLGLASHLKTFPDNEVKKGRLAMQLQKAHELGQQLEWPKSSAHLPVISWDDFVEESKTRPSLLSTASSTTSRPSSTSTRVAATCSRARLARTLPLLPRRCLRPLERGTQPALDDACGCPRRRLPARQGRACQGRA